MELKTITLYKGKYGNGNTALIMYRHDLPEGPEWQQNVTVNIEDDLPENEAFLDTNHLAIDIMAELSPHFTQIGEAVSGFVTYPKVRFDQGFIDDVNPLEY